MKARALDPAQVPALCGALQARGYEVVAPAAGRGRDTAFAPLAPGACDVPLHLANPLLPPKRFVLPPLERLLVFRGEGRATRAEVCEEAPRLAVLGMRSCDVAGLEHLDRFFLGGAYRDEHYARRRAQLLVINVVCTDPADFGPRCFCPCTDTGPAARSGFDLQLMDLGGELLALAGTPAGEALLAEPCFRRATPAHVERRRALLEELRARLGAATSPFSTAIDRISRGDVPEATWEEIGARCLECGGCTYVCPACTCFTVSDRPAGPGVVERVRLWDSCALSGFTRMAGGHNPRKAVHDRRNRRFYRKLSRPFLERERSVACVGCGRCGEVCHGEVGMPQVVELLRRAGHATAGEEARP